MSDDEMRDALIDVLRLYGVRGERLGSLCPGAVADALLPLVRRFAAEELRAAADALDGQARACDDEYDERGFSAYTWAAEVVRARAAVLDPEQVR